MNEPIINNLVSPSDIYINNPNYQIKRVYKSLDGMNKIFNNAKFYAIVIIIFVLLSIGQMMGYGFGISFGAINSESPWKIWSVIVLTGIGSISGVIGASRVIRRRKDFLWWMLVSASTYLVAVAFLQLWLVVLKMIIMIVFVIYQKVVWNRSLEDKIHPRKLKHIQSLIIALIVVGVGVVLGFSMMYVPGEGWNTETVAVNILQGIQLTSQIASSYLIAKKFREGQVQNLISNSVLLIMFGFLSQWTAMLNIVYYLAINLFGYISWSFLIHEKESPELNYKYIGK